MKNLDQEIRSLNSDLLNQSADKYDLRTVKGVISTRKNIKGISDILDHFDNVKKLPFSKYVNDETREEYKKLLSYLKGNPVALQIVEKILTREIMYLGAECFPMGKIGIAREYRRLQQLLTSKYLSLHKVEPPTVSGFIDTWYDIKPKIIIISCHGTKYSLYLNDDEGNCKEYPNTDFFNFFKKRSAYTECVLLSSCESLDLGKMIADDGKNVICISNKVNIKTAAKYTHEFFKYINKFSLENIQVYQNAHRFSLEKIQFEGMEDGFSFEYLKANKIF